MAVSNEYLAKVRRSVRCADNSELNAEITDIIEECRLDLQQVGVLKAKTDDETDVLILGAIRCFVRWKFGLNNPNATPNREDYMQMRDELRKRSNYTEVQA